MMIRGFAIPFIEMKIGLIYHPFVVIEAHSSSDCRPSNNSCVVLCISQVVETKIILKVQG